MKTKLILMFVVTMFTETAATKSYAGWPFSSSSCRVVRPTCNSQPTYYSSQPRCYQQPVQYYQPQPSYYPAPVQYYQPQYQPQYYPAPVRYYQPQQYSPQCYQQQYSRQVVVYVPPTVTTTTRVVWQSRPTAPSCQSGRCSVR